MSAKMSPSAVLILQNGMTKLVNIKHQDAVTKILDMVPDFVNRFVDGKDVTPESVQKAEDLPLLMRMKRRRRTNAGAGIKIARRRKIQKAWNENGRI